MTRISLYPHELKSIVELTSELTRLSLNSHHEDGRPAAEMIGPEIFEKLVKSLYGIGQYPLMPSFHSTDDFKITAFTEVDGS